MASLAKAVAALLQRGAGCGGGSGQLGGGIIINSLSAKSVLAGEKLVATYSIST